MHELSRLYRSEALDAASSRLGGPASLFGVKSWVVVGFLVALTISLLIFISVAKFARKETVVGLVVPNEGVERVSALRAGVIKAVMVGSGENVTVKQPLFAVSFDSVLEGGTALSERLDQISQAQMRSMEQQNQFKQQQIIQSREEIETRISGYEVELARLNEQQTLQRDRVALLEKDYKAAQALIEKQYISELQLAQKRDVWLQSRQTLVQLEQSIGQLQSQIGQLRAQLKSNAMALAEANASLSLDRAQFDEKQLDNKSAQGTEIVARRAGRVATLQARIGDVVAPGQTLALVVPEGKRSQEVQLWVPSRAVGFVRPGIKVRLMFDAFPYQTFGTGSGHVVEVSTAPLMPNELPVPIRTEEQMYRIVVALDRDELTAYGRDWPLMPGMRLSADLVLEEKSFLDWLLDPLLAAKKRAA